ncbi:MAG: hypothetical protein ACYC18_09640 [Gammaproteobacteria bacterium]
MRRVSGYWRGFAPLLAAIVLFVLSGPAHSDPPVSDGRVPLPVLAKAKGKSCVMPTEWMRRNHMNLLLHERDLTTHEGIRIKGRSMEDCVECHVQKEANGQWPAVTSRKFFCTSCHVYAAVKIDCFECHASHPETAAPGTGPGGGDPLRAVTGTALAAGDLTPMPVSDARGGISQ